MRRYSPSLFSEENMWKSSLWLFALLASVLGGACLLDNQEAPDLAGPSTAARSIQIRAIPDAIVSDGFSSSVLEAVMQGPNGERVSGATIIFEITTTAGKFLDLGNLAPLNGARPQAGGVEAGPVSAVTDGDGVARVRYWAPFRTDQENDTTVTIAARESGTNTRGALFAQADIFLRAANRPSFPGTAVCDFIVEPQDIAYKVGEQIFFTATQLTGAAGNPIARYEWDYGDNSPRKTGRDAGHVYTSANTFTVKLFTTESITGAQVNCSKVLDVTVSGAPTPPPAPPAPPPAACAPPTASFLPTPTCPGGLIILADGAFVTSFDGSASSSGAPSTTITSYTWSFGDGSAPVTTAAPTVPHTYAAVPAAGLSVAVSLTVRNSCGATATKTSPFTLRLVCP